MGVLEKPDWFEYPAEYRRLVDQGISCFEPWCLLHGEALTEKLDGLAQRYPDRQLMPFARRTDNDDVACWERDMGQKIVIVHDFATPGWESRGTHPDFWSWFRQAIDDMIEFEP